MGFTFDDSGEADDETPGIPSPIATMEYLIAENPKNAEVIFPYIGGEEINSSPTHAHHRYVINFGERSEEECRREWPELMAILERKVKPERLSKSKEVAVYSWWQHWRPRLELNAAIAGFERVLAATRHQLIWELAFVSPNQVFSEALVIMALDDARAFACLQSSLHEIWANCFGSTMGSADALRYSPTDCFETFPFFFSFGHCVDDSLVEVHLCQMLDTLGDRYHQFRGELMVANNEGLTATYSRFHDPGETDSGILELRRLHGEMDRAVLDTYDWGDVPTDCGLADRHISGWTQNPCCSWVFG